MKHYGQVDREIFLFKDGGMGGIEWHLNEGKGRPVPGDKKPIILMYPGLSGGACNWYTMGLIFVAEK